MVHQLGLLDCVVAGQGGSFVITLHERFDEFAGRYEAELDESGAAKTFLDECAGRDDVILLYGAGDREVNHAVVLERILTELAN